MSCCNSLETERYYLRMNFDSQFGSINSLLGQTQVTFWGTRMIEWGPNGTLVSLDAIAQGVIQSSYRRNQANDLTLAERLEGLELVNKLKNAYQVTDTQIQNSNFLTRFICWVREFTDMLFRGMPEQPPLVIAPLRSLLTMSGRHFREFDHNSYVRYFSAFTMHGSYGPQPGFSPDVPIGSRQTVPQEWIQRARNNE